jgi:flagellar basal-body rod protein FlgG
MNGAFEVAGVGLAAQQRALDAIASNIANINTPAFKRAEVRFSEVMAALSDPANPGAALGGVSPLGGVRAELALALDEQGEIQATGRALDVAIAGDGFIELMGPRGESLLWRGGALSIGEDGLLAGGGGFALRAAIEAPSGATAIYIGADGAVRANIEGAQEAVELGRIMLVRVTDAGALERLDGGLYRLRDGAQRMEATPGEDGAGELLQAAIERSNVNINEEMIRLMIVQRAYAANAQIVQAADQLMAIATGLRR